MIEVGDRGAWDKGGIYASFLLCINTSIILHVHPHPHLHLFLFNHHHIIRTLHYPTSKMASSIVYRFFVLILAMVFVLPLVMAAVSPEILSVGKSYQDLRKIRGHWEGAEPNPDVDNYNGAKHLAMQVIGDLIADCLDMFHSYCCLCL